MNKIILRLKTFLRNRHGTYICRYLLVRIIGNERIMGIYNIQRKIMNEKNDNNILLPWVPATRSNGRNPVSFVLCSIHYQVR